MKVALLISFLYVDIWLILVSNLRFFSACHPCVSSKKSYYSIFKPRVPFSCSHQRFFDYKGIKVLIERLRCREKSYYFKELYQAFSPRYHDQFGGIYDLERLLSENDDTKFNEIEGEKTITKEVFEDIVTKTSA
ncbi:MAG: hypothetical protein LBH36_02875 [Candidatus Nomurabacteria bacterium]|nr:hypothetical protein [Candidatus Nomurabacteria bacterium]